MPQKLPMNFVSQIAVFIFWAILARSVLGADGALVFESDKVSVRATTVVAGLEHPWALAFLPNGEMLITERPGRLRWYKNGKDDKKWRWPSNICEMRCLGSKKRKEHGINDD